VKPLLYAAALERGRDQWDAFEDAPLEHPDPSQPGGVWRPKNFDGTFLGRPVTMRYALDHSLNLPTVRVGLEVGMPAYRDKLRRLGLTGVADELNLASTLGGGVDASPLQMATAYASFANGGERVEPSFVRRVEDASGRVLYERPRPERRRVWPPEVAYVGLDLLLGVVNDPAPFGAGYARGARLVGREVGGKTGTSSDQKDLWFVGVAPGLSAAVWIGRDDNKAMAETVYSGTYAPPVWRDFAEGALRGRPSSPFQVPRGVSHRWVEGVRMAYRPPPSDARPAPAAPSEPDPPPSVAGAPSLRSRPRLTSCSTCAPRPRSWPTRRPTRPAPRRAASGPRICPSTPVPPNPSRPPLR
jgi:membrane peptidoglycan carboxypeptidase